MRSSKALTLTCCTGVRERERISLTAAQIQTHCTGNCPLFPSAEPTRTDEQNPVLQTHPDGSGSQSTDRIIVHEFATRTEMRPTRARCPSLLTHPRDSKPTPTLFPLQLSRKTSHFQRNRQRPRPVHLHDVRPLDAHSASWEPRHGMPPRDSRLPRAPPHTHTLRPRCEGWEERMLVQLGRLPPNPGVKP